MKLRFDQHSIRIRVRKSDIEKLVQEGFIQETVQFPQGALVYRLNISRAEINISSSISNNTIVVNLPAGQAGAWINSDTVGLYATLATEMEGVTLDVLIEKDFPCRHNNPEDNADTFGELSNS